MIFVPEFEVERTRAETSFHRIESYPEYPGAEHPMLVLARVVADLGLRDSIAADEDGYPGILGYQGPALGDVTGARVAAVSAAIEQMLARKSAGEIGQLGSADGVKAGYRGQIGRRSAWAHAIAHNIEFQAGDLLVSETGATRRRSSTSATPRRSSPGWCSRSSPACTTRTSAASASPTPSR